MLNDYPKYSVLMPLFYKEKLEYLTLSLESMMKQTIKPDEIVLIEDHAISDEMRRTINGLSERYDVTVRIYTNHRLDGKGLSAVLAYGVKKCKNEYIARMDTDDIAKSDRCEKELEVFVENPQLSIVGSWVDEFYGSPDNVVNTRTAPKSMEDITNRFKYTNPFNHPSVMYKKSAVLDVGNYNPSYTASEDYELWYRLIKNGYFGTNIQESLVEFRLGENFKKRRRNIKSFKAKKHIKKKMLDERFMNLPEYMVTMTMESIYLYCPFDIRSLLFKRTKEISKRKNL